MNLIEGILQFITTIGVEIKTAIIFFSFLLIGAILLYIYRKHKNQWLMPGGFSLIGAAFVVPFVQYSELRDILVAMAIIFTAALSAMSLERSAKFNKANIEREQKAKNEALLKEQKEQLRWATEIISNWATHVIRHITIPARHAANPIDVKKMMMDCRAELMVDVAESIRVVAIGNELSAHPQLSNATASELVSTIDLVDTSLRDYNSLLFEIDKPELQPNYFNNLMDVVFDLTTKLTNLITLTSRIAFAKRPPE